MKGEKCFVLAPGAYWSFLFLCCTAAPRLNAALCAARTPMVDIPPQPEKQQPEKRPVDPLQDEYLSLADAKGFYYIDRRGRAVRRTKETPEGAEIPQRRVVKQGETSVLGIVRRKYVSARILDPVTYEANESEQKLMATTMERYSKVEDDWQDLDQYLKKDRRRSVSKYAYDLLNNERNNSREKLGHLAGYLHVHRNYGGENIKIRRLDLKKIDREAPNIFDVNEQYGAGHLDEVYEVTDGNKPEGQNKRMVVLECKGGRSKLSVRRDAAGITKIQQGTPQYLDTILTEMFNRSSEEGKLVLDLYDAWDAGRLDYILVRAKVKRRSSDESTYNFAGWEASRFNIKGAAA